jgi:hypothetical protein
LERFYLKRREEKRKAVWRGMQGDPVPCVRVGIGVIAFFFVYSLRMEMPFRCRLAFPGKKKCL